MTAAGEVSWPPAGSFLAAYGEILTAADTQRATWHDNLSGRLLGRGEYLTDGGGRFVGVGIEGCIESG
jgi:hypothetical protein